MDFLKIDIQNQVRGERRKFDMVISKKVRHVCRGREGSDALDQAKDQKETCESKHHDGGEQPGEVGEVSEG